MTSERRSPSRRGAPFGALACAALLAAGCGAALEPIVECAPAGDVGVMCGFQNPEDLAVVPGTAWLLASQMGTMDGARPGSIAVVDIRTGAIRQLFPRGGPGAQPDPAPGGPLWGASDCTNPPTAAFSPHGIDLSMRRDGALQLLVVNHGGRESIEFFEVARNGDLSLLWRGCALAQEGVNNDVVALRDGGFLVTRMFQDGGTWTLLRGLLGLETGAVLEWHFDSGFREVPGTRGSLPNGIEISGDEEVLFENLYGSSEVRKVARRTGERLGVASVPRPDNVTWAADGRLFVASHSGSLRDTVACNEIPAGSCPLAYDIVALDPETLESRVVYSSSGPPMGAGTVAVQISAEIFVGSFAGDRIARVPLSR
jgi:sugar lactone lactonase YvrE